MEAHDRALLTGGRPGLLNQSSVESAIARPYVGYYRSLAEKCAALTQSMAGNHGFVDGNKRTTLIVTNLLIRRSGYELAPLPGEDIQLVVEDLILDTANGRFDRDRMIDWFRRRLRPARGEAS